jgi:hypothetical protein
MPRRTRTKSERQQANNAQRAQEKRLTQLQAELAAEWRSGRALPMDTIAFIRAAEQSHLRRKRRQEQRRGERRLRQMRATA